MSQVVDPIELLMRANPVPDERYLPPTRGYVPAQRALQKILADARAAAASEAARDGLATQTGGGGRGGSRWRTGAIGAAIVVLAVVAAAATWIVQRPSERQDTINCFASPSLEGDVAAAPAAAGADPIAACRQVWLTGAFRNWGNPSSLAGCVLKGGDIGVFPGDPSVCDRLELPRLAEGGSGDPRVGELMDGLTLALTSPNCVDVAKAADLVRERLDQLGLEGWVLIAPATTVVDRPCTSIAFDPPAKTITLVPVPAP
jgi:hypothetical protein